MEENNIKSNIDKIDKLIEICHNEIKEIKKTIEFQINQIKSMKEKYSYLIELIEFKKGEDFASIDKSLISKKECQINNLFHSTMRSVRLLKIKAEDYISDIYVVFDKKIEDLKKLLNGETSSKPELNENSLTEEMIISYEMNLKENISHPENGLAKDMLDINNISEIVNSGSFSNNINSSSDQNSHNTNKYFKCSKCSDSDVQWQIEENGNSKLFCNKCYNPKEIRNENNSLIKIKDRQ